MRKIAYVFLIVLLVLATIPFSRVRGITELTASINPADRAAYAQWSIEFTANAPLKAGYDSIFIQFPEQSVIPCTSCAYAHCQGCFQINGVNAAGAGYYEQLKNAIYLRVGANINAGDKVKISISQSALFQNPATPGTYRIKLWTSAEPEKVTSNEILVISTKIEDLNIEVDPDFTKSKPKVTVTFRTGRLGNMQNGKYIYIRFPEEFTLPQTPKPQFAIINGYVANEAKIDGKTVALRLPYSVSNYGSVVVKIYSSFGIINPEKKGTYTLSVWTDSEPEPVSKSIEIKESDFVRTSFLTNPIEPNGNRGFFISPVSVTLSCETNVQGDAETFFKLDQGEFTKYEYPIGIPEGVHLLSFYSKVGSFVEDVQTREIKIDLTLPEIVLDIKDTVYTYETSFVISGSVSEESNIYINGHIVSLSANLKFSREFTLDEGENTFTVTATDLAGNVSKKEAKIVLDPTTPVLTLESPSKNGQQFKGQGIPVKGNIYPENCNVYVNGAKINVDESGNFNYVYQPAKGQTLVSIGVLAIYPVTGRSIEQKYTIYFQPSSSAAVLTIGKKEIVVDGKVTSMDVAPFIDKASGRTLVPVRFVSEAFGFDVQWDEVDRKVTIKNQLKTIELTIGSKTAYVNGEPVEMDVAPIIKDSRTFVPLRFVSEAMGYNVFWDGVKKTVTITQ